MHRGDVDSPVFQLFGEARLSSLWCSLQQLEPALPVPWRCLNLRHSVSPTILVLRRHNAVRRSSRLLGVYRGDTFLASSPNPTSFQRRPTSHCYGAACSSSTVA